MELDQETVSALQLVGWFPERIVDVTAVVEGLKADGYEVPPIVLDFLTRFSGIHGKAPSGKFNFDAVTAAQRVYPETVASYVPRTGEPLTVIGEAENDHLTLMMSPSGKVYGGFEDFLCLLGDSYAAALHNLFLGRGSKRYQTIQ